MKLRIEIQKPPVLSQKETLEQPNSENEDDTRC